MYITFLYIHIHDGLLILAFLLFFVIICYHFLCLLFVIYIIISYAHTSTSLPVDTCHAIQKGFRRLPSLFDVLTEGHQLVFPHLLMSPGPLLLSSSDFCLD